MKYKIHILNIAVLVCRVHSQLCVGSGSSVVTSPLNGPYVAPQVVTSPVVAAPVVATTIVDNSVSNALANALQLLIVSDLIQSRQSSVLATNALTNCLAPIIENTPLCSPLVDIVEPCSTPVEIIPPCVPVIETPCTVYGPPYGSTVPYSIPITETITPNIFGGYTETISANPFITETSNYCGGWTESILPTPCGTSEIFTPNIAYGSSVIPNGCARGGVLEVVSKSPYLQGPVNNKYEVVPTCGSNFYGAEILPSTPFVPNYCSVPEVVAPSFNPSCIGVTEVIPKSYFNFYSGLPEVISPQFNSPFNSGLPEVFISNCYESATEDILPYNPGCANGVAENIFPFNPNCLNIAEILAPNSYNPSYGSIKELITTTGPCGPLEAEVVLPQAIPAQLTCNFGYMPTSVPCVSVSVEPLPFEPCGCGCNNFPKGFYF